MSRYIPNTSKGRPPSGKPIIQPPTRLASKLIETSAFSAETIPEKQSDNSMWPFSELSLAAASRVGDLANIGLILSLILGVISTFVIVKTTDVKERFWESAREQSNVRISELSTQSDQLRKDTAEANARALEAKLALEKLKMPRSIPASEMPRLVVELSKFAGANAAIYVLGEGPEPNGLAGTIGSLLKQAKWDSLTWNWVGAGAAAGIVVLCKQNAEGQVVAACDALVKAFNSITWMRGHNCGLAIGGKLVGCSTAQIRRLRPQRRSES